MADRDPRTPRTVMPIEPPPLLVETFDRDEVTDLRHRVASLAEASGLAGQRLDDFVLAVNELITNAVRHGGGRGWLRLWCADETVLCEVSDHGDGIGEDRLGGRRPAPNVAGGRGLWLAERLSNEMIVDTGPAGTTVRIAAVLDPAGSSPGSPVEPAS
jgi:serine/threonine-protein kinase RsbW